MLDFLFYSPTCWHMFFIDHLSNEDGSNDCPEARLTSLMQSGCENLLKSGYVLLLVRFFLYLVSG